MRPSLRRRRVRHCCVPSGVFGLALTSLLQDRVKDTTCRVAQEEPIDQKQAGLIHRSILATNTTPAIESSEKVMKVMKEG